MPRLVQMYLDGLLDLDTMIAERIAAGASQRSASEAARRAQRAIGDRLFMSDLDEARLGEWLAANVAGFAGPIVVEKFAGGQSNPTYRIDAASGAYVLRRKPFGPLLPSAHAVEREYRLIAALHPAGFPVARPLWAVRGRRRHRRALLHHGDGRGAEAVGRRAAGV